MSFLNHEIVGTIALSSAGELPAERQRVAEETTLGDLLDALVAGEFNSHEPPRRIVASARISRFVADEVLGHAIIRADVSRLADQLADEYAELAGT